MRRSGKRRDKNEENRVCGNAVCARAIVIAVKSETRPLLTLALPSIAILCTLLEFPEGLSCRGGKEAAAGRRPDAAVPCRAAGGHPSVNFSFLSRHLCFSLTLFLPPRAFCSCRRRQYAASFPLCLAPKYTMFVFALTLFFICLR